MISSHIKELTDSYVIITNINTVKDNQIHIGDIKYSNNVHSLINLKRSLSKEEYSFIVDKWNIIDIHVI